MDLVIRGGQIYDGIGSEPYVADVGIVDGQIAAIGTIPVKAQTEIDATGCIVTPGFVDIHAHYDGQVTWGERLTPSSEHGVTTVVNGNCGVGFAPCRPEDRSSLIELMEGVEDIPEIVMTEGLPWTWTTFPEYLDVVGDRQFDVDVGTQVPHSALRTFVMGERGLNREQATPQDRQQIRELTTQAMHAGALGVGTSDTGFHRSSKGDAAPTYGVAEDELVAIAKGLADAGHGVIETLLDLGTITAENAKGYVELLARVQSESGFGLSFTLLQVANNPDAWREVLTQVALANGEGASLKAQVIARPVGILLGHGLSYNPFHGCPSYQPLLELELEERIERLHDPELRQRLLTERPERSSQPIHAFSRQFHRMFTFSDTIDYEPDVATSLQAEADRLGVAPLELAYEHLLTEGGTAGLYVAVGNYAEGNLDHTLEMMADPNTVLGLGDGGAHLGIICDASWTTHMLSYWGRDREVGLEIKDIVRMMTSETARTVGLKDRGVLQIGYRADVNVIRHEDLELFAPKAVQDLPAGGRRLVQHSQGYVATIVAGEVTYRNGEPTGALPGRLIRGPQAAPSAVLAPT